MREASANGARFHPSDTPPSLSCSPQEEAAVTSNIEEVAWASEPLEEAQLLVIVSIPRMWSLPATNRSILREIVFP